MAPLSSRRGTDPSREWLGGRIDSVVAALAESEGGIGKVVDKSDADVVSSTFNLFDGGDSEGSSKDSLPREQGEVECIPVQLVLDLDPEDDDGRGSDRAGVPSSKSAAVLVVTSSVSDAMAAYLNTYADRAKSHINPAAKELLETIERKQSNLCVSVDVTSSQDFLSIIDAVGPYVSLIKTHIDIIEDFEFSLILRLQELSANHNFLIFEDRKFADIGNTVALQYSSGVHRIAAWSHITNAHPVPGPSIIKGLATVGLPLRRGLLLLAEMSTAGALAHGAYTEDAVRMARDARNFVIGFIAQHRMEGVGLRGGEKQDETEDFLILTPGVGLDATGDGLGQQYRTPKEAVLADGCDIIIVGRGIYGNPGNLDIGEVQRQAKRYREAGWNAYLQRLNCKDE